MIRLVKRYGSRKLYDTEESRYVSLEEIGDWVRNGQEVQVKDNSSGEDVTAQTLALVILEEGRRGSSFFTPDLLHQLIRRGESIVTTGAAQIQQGVDRALDKIPPVRRIREETAQLRARLETLEATLAQLDANGAHATDEDEKPASGTPHARTRTVKGDEQ